MESELRKDLVSGDWIVIAPGRAVRPNELRGKNAKRVRASVKGCPFEDPEKSNAREAILKAPAGKQWRFVIVENKYPAFTHREACGEVVRQGPYSVVQGIGHHELLITRDHDKNFAHLEKKDADLVLAGFRDRYLMLLNDKCLAYTLIFHNWGPKAGASIYHPHYQIISIPVIPPDVEHSLDGSLDYFKRNKKCVHCVMMEWEIAEKKRIIYENDSAVVFAPFISREPFEIRIFPKKHSPYFENSPDEELNGISDALQKGLLKIERRLNDPDYNFFIHTAPMRDKKKHEHYHWHIEILPKWSISAGFELGTGIEITSVDPDEAAKWLRG